MKVDNINDLKSEIIKELQYTLYEFDQIPLEEIDNAIYRTINEIEEQKLEKMDFHMLVFEVKEKNKQIKKKNEKKGEYIYE